MLKRLAAYCIIGIFIVAILLQLNTYLSFISIPTQKAQQQQVPVLERYQREYTTLITYFATLCVSSLLLLFKQWLDQYKYKKNKLLGFSPSRRTSPWQRWLRYEWRLFSTSTWSILHLLQISLLIGINSVFLFKDAETDVVMDDRNMGLQMLANRSAQLALTNIAMSVLLSAKLSLLQRHFFAVQQTLAWHAWFGRLGFFQVLYHATYQLQFNYARQSGDLLTTFFLNVRYVTGTLMMCAVTTLVLGSHPTVRHFLSYRLFRWTHLGSFMTLICFGCLHHWAFYVFYVTVLVFWVTDQMDRFFQVESCKVEPLPGNIVKLTCQVPYSCGPLIPGQFAFLSFESTSWIKAWIHSHPFSICSVTQVNGADQVTFYIKANGKDTLRLYHRGRREIKARISRPLGRPYITNAGSEFGDYESIVLIAEGVGITPWISVFHYIQERQHAIQTQSVRVIWSIHQLDIFYAFEKEFEDLIKTVPQEIDISIQVFITGDSEEEEDYSHNNSKLSCIQFVSMQRPNYTQLLHDIHQVKKDVVLGICAHEETIVKANNIGVYYSWDIKTERFEL